MGFMDKKIKKRMKIQYEITGVKFQDRYRYIGKNIFGEKLYKIVGGETVYTESELKRLKESLETR